MKIVFLNIYQGRVNRGLETYVTELSKRLKVNHKVDVLSGNSTELKRWPIIWRFYLDPHGIRIMLFTMKLILRVWKEKYDVVFPLNGGWQPFLIRIVTWFYGGKIIIPGQSGKGWDDRFNLWSFPDVFVALSSEGSLWAKKVNPFVKCVYITNGVDLEKFSFSGQPFKVTLKRPIVLVVAALTPSKRVDLAIKAVSKLDNVSLLVVGDGELKYDIDQLGRKLLKKRFILLKVPYTDMPKVYRTADVLTLPSKSTEAFGNVLVEAMSSNLPVVATDDLIRREIIGEAGLLINPENIDIYAKNLLKALKFEWKDTPRRVAEKFSWDTIANDYEKLFKELKNE